MSSTDKYIFLLRMKPFLSFFLWNLTGIFYPVETLHKILCRNFSSKRQISLFFQLLIQIANDLISRCLFYFKKFTYIGAFKNNLFCIISTSCILNIYLFIYSVLADAKSDIIFRNLANYFNFTVSICVISESWSLYH